jgi:monoamine oxidase
LNAYALLTKPLYIGQVVHRGKTYPGQQDAIINLDTFNQVHALINANAPYRRQTKNQVSPHLLTGLLFDETGDALSPTHAVKNGKRYRYYTSHQLKSAAASRSGGWRLAAEQIENVGIQLLSDHLSDRDKLDGLFSFKESSADQMLLLTETAKQFANQIASQTPIELKESINKMVRRIELKADRILIKVCPLPEFLEPVAV